MKRLSLAPSVLALLWVAAPGGAYRIAIPPELPKTIAELTKEYHRAKLAQISILLDDYSGGESRLLVGSPASAAPQVRQVIRAMDWGDIPFITVYPAARPVEVKLDGIGHCQLLGAVALLVEATATGGDDKFDDVVAPADVYLLAYGVNEGWLGEVRLIAVGVDDEGRRKLDVVLRTLAAGSRPTGVELAGVTAIIPNGVVEFPGKGEVSDDNPAWRAHVRLIWPEHLCKFALDLRLTMG